MHSGRVYSQNYDFFFRGREREPLAGIKRVLLKNVVEPGHTYYFFFRRGVEFFKEAKTFLGGVSPQFVLSETFNVFLTPDTPSENQKLTPVSAASSRKAPLHAAVKQTQ